MCLIQITHRSRSSSLGASTTPDSASDFLNMFCTDTMGCRSVSTSEKRDVSRTREGLPAAHYNIQCTPQHHTYVLHILPICHPSISQLISLSKFNLPLIGTFYMTHAARALQSHDLSGEGIKLLWITYILFWPHKDMKRLPGWVISPMPGPPPRQHKHQRQYTPSTHTQSFQTRRIWNDDYDVTAKWYSGTLGA